MDSDSFYRKYVAGKVISVAVYDHLLLDGPEAFFTPKLFTDENTIVSSYTVSSEKLMKLYNERKDIRLKPSAITQDGVDLSLFKPENLERFENVQGRTIRIGWVGNSKWQVRDLKGINTVIKPAIDQLIGEGYNVELVTSDRNDRMIPHEKMPGYYNQIDLYVCASLCEGTPNPVLEAMAMGTPVIGADARGTRDLLADGCGILVPVGDTGALARAFRSVAEQSGARVKIESLVLTAPTDENDGRYRARVEYSLTGGGWRPSEAKTTDVLTGPTAVSFADVPNDIDAVRVTYLNAQTGEELAGGGFTPGQITLNVKTGVDGAATLNARTTFAGTLLVQTQADGAKQAIARTAERTDSFGVTGSGMFAAASAGVDGTISGIAFLDSDADGVMDADVVLGPLGIVVAHSILGEVTPRIAEAVGGCRGKKILVPMNSCGVSVAGTQEMGLAGYVKLAADQAEAFLRGAR